MLSIKMENTLKQKRKSNCPNQLNLGTYLESKNDMLSCPYSKLLETEKAHTKRGISKKIPAIYDTNGEIALFILRGKVILSTTRAYDKSKQDEQVNNAEDKETHRLKNPEWRRELVMCKSNRSTFQTLFCLLVR